MSSSVKARDKTPVKILFQSDDVVIVHKPAGWLSVPSIQGTRDPRPVVGIKLRDDFGSVYPVHRLDFEVEGILLFALHSKAQKLLHKIWEDRSVHKVYQAVTQNQNFDHWPPQVEGLIKDEYQEGQQGQWQSHIVQGKRRSFIAPHGQDSVTEFHLLKRSERGLHWQLSPLTGRRHQLRLELSRRGFPIHGDQLYGSHAKWGEQHIALAATQLKFDKNHNLQLPSEIKIDWDKA